MEANPDLQIKEDKDFHIKDINISPHLDEDARRAILAITAKYASVFSGSKQSLPKLFKHAPISLKLKDGAKPRRAKEPSWDSAYGKIIRAWAEQGLKTGLLEECTGPWASRIHLAGKPAQGQSKHEDITKQGLRVCADLRDCLLYTSPSPRD